MDIRTNNEARSALGQLTEDLHSVYEDVPNIDALVGNSQLQSSAYSLLDGINNYAAKVYAALSETDDALTATQKKQMQELQREVVAARKMIAQTISDVAWSFPDLVVESLTDSGKILGEVTDTVTRSAGGIIGGILGQFGIFTWVVLIAVLLIGFAMYTGRNPLAFLGGK